MTGMIAIPENQYETLIHSTAWCPKCFDSLEEVMLKDENNLISAYQYYCSGCDAFYRLQLIANPNELQAEKTKKPSQKRKVKSKIFGKLQKKNVKKRQTKRIV